MIPPAVDTMLTEFKLESFIGAAPSKWFQRSLWERCAHQGGIVERWRHCEVKSSGKPGSLGNCGTCFGLGLTSQSWSSFALLHSQVT